MPNLNAALGIAQLENLEKFIDAKRQVTKKYIDFFKHSDINFKSELPGTHANYWLNTIALPNQKQRDEFLHLTNDNGIMTRPVWDLMIDLPMYRHCKHDGLKVARNVSKCLVNIPSSVPMDKV